MITTFLFLFIFSSLCVVYPYIIYPLILRRLPKLKVAAESDTPPPSLSFLFCAFNEEAVIRRKIDNLIALKELRPTAEFFMYDDNSNDDTARIVEKEAPFVRIVHGAGRTGKAHGMKLMADMARGEALVFTDANVMFDPEGLEALENAYKDPNVGGLCGSLIYLSDEDTTTANVGSRYWLMEEKLKDLESLTGNVMGADGSIFSIRRELYPKFPDTVLDDLTVSMSVIFQGHRLIKVNEVKAYEKLVTSKSDEFARKVRISTRAFHTHQQFLNSLKEMHPIDKFKYHSHRTIRWFGGAFLFFGAASLVAGIAVYSSSLALVVLLCGIAVLGLSSKFNMGPVSSATEICLAMVATLIGVTRAARGQTVVTWKPAESRN